MNNDIRKLIEDNWGEIKELIAQKAEAEQKPKTIWDLKVEKGEECYCIQTTGIIIQYPFDRSYEDMITDARDLGNAFLTWKEAKFERERRKIEAILRKYSRPFKSGKTNYVVIYDAEIDMVLVRVAQYHNSGTPVFESKEITQKAINEIGEDGLIKYWFGVTK